MSPACPMYMKCARVCAGSAASRGRQSGSRTSMKLLLDWCRRRGARHRYMCVPASEAGERACNFLDSFVEYLRELLHFAGRCVEDRRERAAKFSMFFLPQFNGQRALMTAK